MLSVSQEVLRNQLGEKIGNIVVGLNIWHDNIAFLYMAAKEVVLSINVLKFQVHYGIFCHLNAIIIVSEHSGHVVPKSKATEEMSVE